MHPRDAIADTTDGRCADAILLRDRCGSRPYGKMRHYFQDLRLSQRGISVGFAARPRSLQYCAALQAHVTHVISLCAQKKMRRVYAGRSIARMAYAHSYWDGAAVSLVGNSGRAGSLVSSVRLDHGDIAAFVSIRVRRSSADPDPAAILGRIDLSPNHEPLFSGHLFSCFTGFTVLRVVGASDIRVATPRSNIAYVLFAYPKSLSNNAVHCAASDRREDGKHVLRRKFLFRVRHENGNLPNEQNATT